MQLVVLADTHIRDGSGRALSTHVWDAIDAADAVLHAGDVVGADFLGALEKRARTWAVLGNNDYALGPRLPETLELDLEGVKVAMIHDSGPSRGRSARMASRFPSADLVIFGHSHDPCDETSPGGPRLFNPGSAVERRRQPFRTYGVLELSGGQVTRHDIVPLSPGD